MDRYNKALSEIRRAVAWHFGNVKSYFEFAYFKQEMKLCLNPVGKSYSVCGLLQNAHTCLYEDEVAEVFGTQPPTLQEYFL